MWMTPPCRELPRGYRRLEILRPNPRSGDPRRRELAKREARFYAELLGGPRLYVHTFEDWLETFVEAAVAAVKAAVAAEARRRSRLRTLAQLRLLKTLLLRLVRILMAVAMHPDRCIYLMTPREFCVRYGDRVGPVGTTSC